MSRISYNEYSLKKFDLNVLSCSHSSKHITSFLLSSSYKCTFRYEGFVTLRVKTKNVEPHHLCKYLNDQDNITGLI